MTFILSVLIFISAPVSCLGSGKAEMPIWREWYTFTRGGIPSGFYVENFHRKPGLLVIEQVIFERSATGITETFVHSEANDNASASPASFYVKKRQLGSVDVYEGIVSGKEIGIRIHVGQENKIPATTLEPLKPGVVFGAFVPYFLSKMGTNKAQQQAKFESLLEEGDERKFTTAKITAASVATTLKVGKETCSEYRLTFNEIPASWWVTSAGKLCQMLIPSLGSELRISTESEAKKFL